jgi:tetratricopeptide (TPR) repeat protein
MSDRANLGQISQSTVENVQVGGNLTIGNITQFVGHRQPSFRKPTGIPQNIPHSGAAQFIGRARELEALHQQLQRTEHLAISAISGMGGVGKTELAIQYAIQYKSSYPGGVCWLKARTSNLSAQLVDFVQLHLGLAVPQELWGKILTLEQQVEWCWQHWRPSGLVLVVLDDVTDLASCREVLPPAGRFRVLVTTRQRRLDASFFELSLDVLSPEASLELLTALVGQSRIERELQAAKRLCEWLGYLPLGLELVGRYLAEDLELSFTLMLKRLEVQRLQDEAIANEQQRQNNYFLMTAQHSVRAAFELSWQELDITACEVARLLGLFAPDVILWELVESTGKRLNWSEQLINNARKQLYKWNLIQQAGEGYYKIHPLIREFLQAKLVEAESANDLKRAFVMSISAVEPVPKSPTIEQIQKIAPVIPHVKQAVKTLIEYLKDEYLCKPFIYLANFYEGQGLYNLAEPWHQQCLSVAQMRLGLEHADVAETLSGLAMIHLLQGRYSEAESLFLQALELRKRLLGDNHLDVAESLHGLAMLYLHQGHYSKSEPLFMQAVELRKESLGSNHTTVAESLHGQVNLYLLQGRYHEAEYLAIRTLEIREELFGREHIDVAESKNLLALICLSKAHFQWNWLHRWIGIPRRLYSPLIRSSLRSSELLAAQSIELKQRLLGLEHPLLGVSLNTLAMFYVVQGRYRRAEPLFWQAIELYKCAFGDEHPYVVQSLSNLALLYYIQGRYRRAEPLFYQVLELYKKILGNNHPLIPNILQNLAWIHLAKGHYRKAEYLLIQALELSKEALEANHPHISIYRGNLVLLIGWLIILTINLFFITVFLFLELPKVFLERNLLLLILALIYPICLIVYLNQGRIGMNPLSLVAWLFAKFGTFLARLKP